MGAATILLLLAFFPVPTGPPCPPSGPPCGAWLVAGSPYGLSSLNT